MRRLGTTTTTPLGVRAVAAVAVTGLLIAVLAVLDWARSPGGPWDSTEAAYAASAPERLSDPRPSARRGGGPVSDTRKTDRKVDRKSDRKADPKADRSAGAPDRSRPVARPPVRVSLPAVGYDAPVRGVGVSSDGQMALPADPRVLGWYRFGPAPGAGTGAAVLAGHLDSTRFGLGPLVLLREVAVGDRVVVQDRRGAVRRYAVTDVRRFDRQALPAGLFARTGPDRLHLITCGGAYLPDAGGYQENLVVTARPL